MAVNCTVIVALSLMALSILPVTLSTTYAQSDKEWQTTYAVGKFLYNDPPKPDQIFKIQYRVINGTMDEFIASQYGVAAQVNSNGNATLEVVLPRNFPYTNDPSENGSGEQIFFVNGLEDFPPEKVITDCFFTYSLPYTGMSKIELVFTYLGIEAPLHGDKVPDSCISETIVEADTLTPLVQLRAGVAAADVACREGFELVVDPNDKPYCATPASAEILKERWS